jgi:hypothetical protein
MADLPTPEDAFNRLNTRRTRAIRNVINPPGSVHPNTRNDFLNRTKQRSGLFGYNPDIDAVAEEAGFAFSGVMDVEDKAAAAAAQEIWVSNDLWEGFEAAPGGKRQARGFEYDNYSANPITPQTGAINTETGERVSTGPVSFNEDREDDVEIPTSTENPERPRTVAAAFDNDRSIITLIFRDGTIYNYYNCTQKMWETFKGNTSKWKYVRDTLDKQPRGIADMSQIPEELRIIAYGRARGEQIRKAKAGGWQPRTRARYYDISKAKANGKNPADYQMVRKKSKGFK